MKFKTENFLIVWLITACILIFIMVIIGGITRLTHSGLSIVEWAKDYPDLPILIAYSAPEDVTMRKRQYNVLRPGWTGTQDNYYLGKYVVEEKGWKKVIMIGQDYSFPWGQTHGFIRRS